MKHTIFILCCLLLLLTGCANLLENLIWPNQCVRCEVKNWYSSVWCSETCGGGSVADLETECKAVAYDYNQNGTFSGDYVCDCNSYKKEE